MTFPTSMSPEEAADRLAIRQLIDAYAHCADGGTPRGRWLSSQPTRFLRSSWTADPQSPHKRCVAVMRSAPVFENLNTYQATTHFNGQSAVEIQGNTAKGESYCIAHHLTVDGEKRTLMVVSIRYLDTFTKQNGAWLFAERKLMVDWTDTRGSVA